MKNTSNGFTLIEVLVVVLIIGILSSIALPQYQKSLQKTNYAQVFQTFNKMSEAIDIYLTTYGYPSSGYVWFTGENNTSSYPYADLDISFPWERCENNASCFDKFGGWTAYCNANEECSINLWTSLATRSWYNNGAIHLQKSKDGDWVIKANARKDICSWIKSTFGTERMKSSLKQECASLGIS